MSAAWGAFLAPPAPATEADTCKCGCPLQGHCKGGVEHSSYKLDSRMTPMVDRKIHTCTTRHCLTPLCDCVDYKEQQ